MQSLKSRGLKFYLSAILTVMVCCTAYMRGATIRILVLNGHNGRPITDERLNVRMTSDDPKVGYRVVPTNDKGVAIIEADENGALQIETNLYFDCRPFKKYVPSPPYNASDILKARPTYHVGEIMSHGVVAPNICGKYGREPIPGEVILFARPVHRWEAIRR